MTGSSERAAMLDHARGRLANAERIGRPAHIARCRARVEGIQARINGASA